MHAREVVGGNRHLGQHAVAVGITPAQADLELLLPIARARQVPLDELVGAPPVGDPRARLKPIRRHDATIVPLTGPPGGLQAYKMVIDATRTRPDPRTHEGYEWLYVLSGRLRLVLADHDIVLETGEAAELDTRLAHWFGSTGDAPVEILSLSGRRASACTSGPSRADADRPDGCGHHPILLYLRSKSYSHVEPSSDASHLPLIVRPSSSKSPVKRWWKPGASRQISRWPSSSVIW